MRPRAPSLDDQLTRGSAGVFTILIYADKDTEVSEQWKDSDAHLIAGGAEQVRSTRLSPGSECADRDGTPQVKLRSFSTAVHKVEAMVAYRCVDPFLALAGFVMTSTRRLGDE